jgi:hypothetical protein
MRPLATSALLLTCGAGCLPTDTRPPPAEVTFTASSSEQTHAGIELTVDGYHIDFERLLMAVGQARIGDDGRSAQVCSEYSSANYTRLFDFVRVGQAEKVNLVYALGHCALDFTVRYPNPDAKVGTGATDADAEFMRTPGSDAYAQDAGVSVYVIGSAEREGVNKHFAWPFRERIGYQACWVPDGDTRRTGVDLASDGSVAINVEMQAEALFRDRLDPAVAMLRFQPFADADVNADGEITLDELDSVEVAPLAPLYQYSSAPDPDGHVPYFCADKEGAPVSVRTLGDYAYCALAPSIARFEGNGGCDIGTGRPRRDD